MRIAAGSALARALEPMFEGDEHRELKLAQVAAYSDALVILIGAARARLTDAEAILQHRSELGAAVRRNRFDDRRLEEVVGLLAAIWRLRRRIYQEDLPGLGPDVPTLLRDWLTWLSGWSAGWMNPFHWRWILLIGYGAPVAADAAYADLMEELRAMLVEERKAAGVAA